MDQFKNVCVVLDVSLRHTEEGSRLLDVVKSQLVEFIREEMVNGEDSFYLYHPAIVELLYYRGDQVGAVGNYESDGSRSNINLSLKQCLYVAAAESEGYDRHVFLISDRLQAKDRVAIERFHSLNERDYLECNLFVVGVGDRYSLDLPFEHAHLEKSTQLKEFLKESCNGSHERSRNSGTETSECENIQSSANEQCK